ncbi:HNH endonuclease signature motif containing protein [Mycolicibacterium lacusdiani]|uniref:HNH endonuclease signature motif containing protein n=1 Tax=Mycolicibacterium lacusdiani TaxID=2895283 RepID=UPI001F1B15F4|nr:HNH endonuclease signature motif containing protein [Mycolicibacterium lacusdiani]
MLSAAAAFTDEVSPQERLEVLFGELAELTGQRNAINGRIVDIVAEIDGEHLWGSTGCRSIASLVAWKIGVTPRNAETIVAIAHRLEEFPRCAEGMRKGRLSVDQVGVIAERAADGSDEHYVGLAEVATVAQLRTAVKLEPRPEPKPKTKPQREITRVEGENSTTWRITLPRVDAAKFDAGLQSHRDALIAEWKRDRDPDDDPETVHDGNRQGVPPGQAPFPDGVDAFMSLIEAGWDADVERRPHGQHTTVVVHLDVEKPLAALHLGSVLSDEDRRYLLCDATCEAWLERRGRVIGAGRTTRSISRRLRRALEHRDRCCVVPGCGATRGLQAHHLVHWENGGHTELHNLVLMCPYHHRAHHRGDISLTGPADRLVVTDIHGTPLTGGSLARPPTTPPLDVPPCEGPLGESAQWWWYTPFERPPSPD